MFGSSSNDAIKTYSKISIETGIIAANPHQLIVLLFDGAIQAICEATIQLQANHIAEKGRLITRAILIIESGLRASLNKEAGGELALNLDELYSFLMKELIIANMDNDEKKLSSVKNSLMELRSAWLKIAPHKMQAAQGTQAAHQTDLAETTLDPLAPRNANTNYFSA